VVGAASRRINLPHLHSHAGAVLHGDVSKLMASCVCQSLRFRLFGGRFDDIEEGG
jgi:hypothetical protein